MAAMNHFINIEVIKIGSNSIKIFNLLLVLAIFIVTKTLAWLIKKLIHKRRQTNNIDHSNVYALVRISSYILWIVSILFMLESIGIKLTFFLAGSAALLVGIGLGLQQTFNDFISGLILLFEGTTKVDDILEVDGDIVQIQSIGLRTSKAINRYDISIIIPNSLITTNKVVNWSHLGTTTLFTVKVGVAYGSDVDLVIELLKECARIHPEVIRKESADVRFSDFGASSLNFTVLFYAKDIFGSERIKSEIRINIARAFKQHNISVPFNQLDVYLKNQ